MLDLAVAESRMGVERVELGCDTPPHGPDPAACAIREPGTGSVLLGADAARDLAAWWEVERSATCRHRCFPAGASVCATP